MVLNKAQRLATGATGFVVARTLAAAPERPFADFEIIGDPSAAAAAWAEIYSDGLATPYQSYAFVETWLRTIGRAEAIEPMIVVARDEEGRVSAILPLCRRRRLGLRVAEFVGGKHANFHMGVYRSGLSLDRDAILDLLRRVARAASLDAFVFVNQPRVWQKRANPFATLAGQPSPSLGHATQLKDDFASWLEAHYSKAAQKKLRKKARRLAERGPVSSFVARDATTAATILAAFFVHKGTRARAMGFSNDYEDAAAVRFLEAASSERLSMDRSVIELHALRCGERIVAVFGGVARAGRFCGMIISYDQDAEIARSSPGELLVHEVIRDLTARGFTTFDLGVGEARYKDICCEEKEPLFDMAAGFTLRGRLAVAAFLSLRAVKRWIKRRPWAWSIVAPALRRPH
jgi:CelD/BcsL family acetyltransferase involved in cellulose biosynthesis